MATFIGTADNETLIGGSGNDFIDGRDGNDVILGRGGSDTIVTGVGSDTIGYDGDPFDGVDVSAAGRQAVGNEDFLTDFNFALDRYQFDATDFRINGALNFQSLDATVVGASIRPGANVIVLLNADNDASPATPFNAAAAANQIANLVNIDGAGFFVYFNSVLNVNRLVYSANLNDPTADLKIISRHTDLTGPAAIAALANFTAANFVFADEILTGTMANDILVGFGGRDTIDAGSGNDVILGRGGQDTITTGAGSDLIAYDGDPFDGVNVSAPGRQVSGNEDFITDFDFAADAYRFDARDFNIASGLSFQSLDGNAPGAAIRPGVNVVVLTNADNDANSATPFNAASAAAQVASLISTDGAGFFVYFNTTLNANRLVYSSNLNDPAADLKIVSRHTDLLGTDATGALSRFVAANFRFDGDTIVGTARNDILTGFGGTDTITGGAGNDIISGRGGSDTITTGNGSDVIVIEGPAFDGANVSAAGRQFGGNEDFITDFDFGTAITSVAVTTASATTAAVLNAALAGNIYFNLHSARFPAGEVRGQLALANDGRAANGTGSVTFTSVLNGANEVPAVATNAQGNGSITFTVAANGSVTYTTQIDVRNFDVSQLRVGHLHNGAVGMNGPVVVDLVAAARSTSGSITGSTDRDVIQLDLSDFGLTSAVSFQALDGNAPGAAVRPGANVIVLTNADDDNNATTPFNAGAAANQVASLVTTDGPGFFVYFNSVLNVNRIVYSTNLNDPTADLKIVARLTDLTGTAAIEALSRFSAANFSFGGDVISGTAANDTLSGTAGNDVINGGAGDDRLSGGGGDDVINGGAGVDTVTFAGRLADFSGTDLGERVVITGPEGRDSLIGIERLEFSDGSINLDDGNPLFDTLFYYQQNPDVFAAGVDALLHYRVAGAREGRDPNPFFDTSFYLANNPDVAAAGVNPLDHYQVAGAREGRDPSASFDTSRYLEANPDVAAAGVEALLHFLVAGRSEGRVAFPVTSSSPLISGSDKASLYSDEGDAFVLPSIPDWADTVGSESDLSSFDLIRDAGLTAVIPGSEGVFLTLLDDSSFDFMQQASKGPEDYWLH